MVSRRVVQTILGVLWLVDGLFQLKPQMFTQAFIQQVIIPTSQGQPSWISSIVNWGAHLVIPHIALWNVLFAIVQLALGTAFILNFRIKVTVVASLIWCLIVWIFGEGMGQLLTGQALLLTGAPGAVFIYGLIGIAILPADYQTHQWNPWAIRFAQVSLAVLWIVGVVLHFQHVYLTPAGLSQVIAVPWLAKVVSNHGILVSGILGFIELVLAVSLLLKSRLRFAVWVSIVLSLFFWWTGQSFGQVFAPLSTDVNSGPLMALLAVCAYPRLWNAELGQIVQPKVS